MTTSPLDDAFDHHIWATLRVIDACEPLSPEQLEATVPGTYGSIIETLRHLVGADAAYLWVMTDGSRPQVEEETMDLPAMRAAMVDNEPIWAELLAQNPDMSRMVVRQRDDGSAGHAPLSIRLAQALHHGTDHRSQICTALTTLGIAPPEIDVWAYAEQDGRAFETPPPS
ncbi:MAG: hypothetical protein M3R49_11290 [Chloroflexota bacterium]|nr:hypothetical protein [Chloroflexota bacterium]